MRPYTAKNVVHKLIIPNLSFVIILLFLGVGYAQPFKSQDTPVAFTKGKRGQEAIIALQDHLPEAASRYRKSPEKFKKTFLHDKDLWLDPAENLLYLCSFDVSEVDTPPESGTSAIPSGPFSLDQTFQLHSLPGASRVIYLDFDGHVTSGTYWNSDFNSGADIVSFPYNFEGNNNSFSNNELSSIQNIWARVAEDFAIYEIDVTTEDPGLEALRRIGSGDGNYGIRVVISPTTYFYPDAGGVAYIGSFAWNSDTPTFVFPNKLAHGETLVADVTTHETGHTLGLFHDGVTDGPEYYSGHANWAPIMGAGFFKTIIQWSKGEYDGANNTEDDLAVMLNYGAIYRQDDHGDWIDSATMLSGLTIDASGIIERTGDMDVFGFQANAGNISINVDPASLGPNLDILVQIFDEDGNIINEDDPYNILPARLNLNLPAGNYYILIDGVGTGDPNTGYTDYGSLGQYFISGTLPDSDSDGDGIADAYDNCPGVSNPSQTDTDEDGLGDACDFCNGDNLSGDTDNDGICDNLDLCPNDLNKTEPGICGCGISDVDSDSDGTTDCSDECPDDPNKTEPSTAGCGYPEGYILPGVDIETTPSNGVSLTFEEITTGGTCNALVTDNPSPPTNYRFFGHNYVISCSVSFSGTVTLCFGYVDADINENEPNIKLMHRENGGPWSDITTSLDTQNNIICGQTTSLSEFAIFEPISVATSGGGGGGGGGGIFGDIIMSSIIGYHLDGVTTGGTQVYMPVTSGFKALKGAQEYVRSFAPNLANFVRECFDFLEQKADADKQGFLYNIGTLAFPVLGEIVGKSLELIGEQKFIDAAYSDTTISNEEFKELEKRGLAIAPKVLKNMERPKQEQNLTDLVLVY